MKKGAVLQRSITFTCLQLIFLYSANNALAAKADYEYRSVCPSPSGGRYSLSSDVDKWNFYKCECTSYAAQMINKNGVYFHNKMKSPYASSLYYQDRWSHARYWKAKALSLGYTVSSTPVPGAIAWWGAASWNSNYGHVAYVDSVSNGKANISEYNYKPRYEFGTRPSVVADAYIIFGGSGNQSKPSAPAGLSASASGTNITLRWTDASSNESGFNVYRSTGSSWTSIITTGKDITSITNSGLPSNTTYSYKVCSYNTAGESCSSSVSAKTGTAGTLPSSVSVNPSSGSWTSNQNLAVTSAGATTIYYKMVNTYDGSTPSDPSSPSASSNDGNLNGSSATFELWGRSGYLKKSKLRFVGCNRYGCGAASGVYSYSIDYRPTKPATPGSQSATATSSSSITLRWSDLSSDESGFTPYRWNGSSWSSLGNVSANLTSYVNSGLPANTTYYYTVCSYNSAGESCPSNYVSATTTSSGSSGSSWDGKSPSGTACEQDATTVASRSNSYGKVQLRWSSTCKTNWTRVVPNSSSYSTSGKIRRTSDGRSYTTSGTGTRFTNMVYAPTVQACASGSIKGYSLSEVCR